MRFLVDAQLSIGLARMLQQHGHESKHVDDLNMMQTSDRDIWVYQSQAGQLRSIHRSADYRRNEKRK